LRIRSICVLFIYRYAYAITLSKTTDHRADTNPTA
jgi:hypothetical protein